MLGGHRQTTDSYCHLLTARHGARASSDPLNCCVHPFPIRVHSSSAVPRSLSRLSPRLGTCNPWWRCMHARTRREARAVEPLRSAGAARSQLTAQLSSLLLHFAPASADSQRRCSAVPPCMPRSVRCPDGAVWFVRRIASSEV
jgi:hypothetical protein